MNFREQLVDSSKLIVTMVASNVGCNPEYYRQILSLVLREKMPLISRAGRVLNICTEKYPWLFLPHVDEVIREVQAGILLHSSILKIFAERNIELSEDQEGILVDAAFRWLSDNSQPVSVKVYCMEFLKSSALKEPGLTPELVSILKELIPGGTPGIKNRAGKIIRTLQKRGLL